MKAKSIKLRGLYPAPSVPFDRDLNIIEDEFAIHIATMGRIKGLGGVAVNGHQGEVAALTPRGACGWSNSRVKTYPRTNRWSPACCRRRFPRWRSR